MADEDLDGDETLLTGPDEGKPDEGKPDEGKPDEGKPDEGKPDEGKPDEGKPDEGKPDEGKPDEGQPDEGKPVEYKDFTVPEGVELNQEVLGTFKEFATEAKLSQEQAQAAVDMGLKLVENVQTQQTEAFKVQRQEWNATAKADPEFGRDNLVENLIGGKAVLEKYGSKELITFLGDSGIGDHPEVIRLLVNIHKATKEDSLPPGSGNVAADDKGAFSYGASDHN